MLDVWLGSLLCGLLTALRCLARLLGFEHAPAGPVRRIVFLKLIEQGATVLACDAFHRAAEKVGREQVYFLVFEENRPILDLLDLVPPENVLVIRRDGFLLFLRDTLKALARLRSLRVDALVDLEFFSRASAVLAYCSGATRRVGLHGFTNEGPYRGDLMTHRVQYNPYLHTATLYALLVEALWMDAGDLPLPKIAPPVLVPSHVPRFAPAGESLARVKTLLAETGVAGGALVLLNPNASDLMPLRKWDLERFVALAKRLLADDDRLCIIFTGAPSEQAAVEAICREAGSPRAVSFAGKTSLYDLMALYTLADVLVTNDSGPGHFASLTDIDAVVLFGPETPARYGPLGTGTHAVWAGLACSPCINPFNHRFSPCTRSRCMDAITVEAVAEEVRACLSRRQHTA